MSREKERYLFTSLTNQEVYNESKSSSAYRTK